LESQLSETFCCILKYITKNDTISKCDIFIDDSLKKQTLSLRVCFCLYRDMPCLLRFTKSFIALRAINFLYLRTLLHNISVLQKCLIKF